MKRFLLAFFFLISTYSVVVTASEQDPILTRVYGDAYVPGVAKNPGTGTPGALDLTFGTDGGRNLTSVFGDNTQAQAIRILANGTSIIATDDPDNNQVKVARFDGDGYVDTTFGTSGVTVIAQQNAMDLYIDAQGRIVVVGAGDNGSWIARLSSAGALDTTTFGGVGSDPAGIAVGETDIGFFGLGQQQSGRLIAVGQDTTNGGVVYAFRSDGVVDQSFGITTPFRAQTSVAYGSRGSFKITDAVAIYSVAIDPTTDELYVAYVDTSNNAVVAKILADGDDYNINFGPSGANAGATAAADRIPNIASESPVHAVIDDSGKIILAAVNTSNQYVVRRYLADGSVDTTFNGTGAALTIAATNKAILTHLMMTQAEQAILIGYDDNADNNMMMIRLNSNGTLDTAFSANGVLPYQLDAGNTIRESRFAAIHPTGKILTVGYEQDVTSSDDDPVIVSVYGDSFVPEYKQAPSASQAGTLDNTFNGGTSPTQIVDDITGLTTLNGKLPKLMHSFYQTPGYLLVAQGGTSTYITKLTQDLELDSTFNSGVLVTQTTGTVSSETNGLCFDKLSGTTDSSQSFFLVGTDVTSTTNVPWARHYDSAGNADANFVLVPASGMVAGNVVEQQSFGRLIIGGSTSSTGLLAAQDVYGNIDTGFGSGTGQFTVTGSTAVYAMAIDDQDRIVVAYKDSSDDLVVSRIDESGFALDSSFSATDLIANVSADDQVKISFDQNGDIIVAAATATDYRVRCYSQTDGTLNSSFNGTGELAFQFSTTTGTPKITQLMVESSGKILVLGFNDATSDFRAIQTRLLTTGYLDTSFNADAVSPYTPGILEINNGTQDFEFYSQAIQLDRRLMLYGRDKANGDLLLTRVFGDDNDYVTVIESEPVNGIAGAADLSLQNTGYSDLTALVGSYKAKVIRAIEAGKTLVAIDTGTVTNLVRLTTESALDTTFNNGGISATTCPTGVFDMFVDTNGKILVAGSVATTGRLGGTGEVSWVRRYNADGSSDTSFGTTGLVSTNIADGLAVKDQQNGRILLSGFDNSAGSLIAYTSNGVLDTSFGNGTGKIAIGTTGVYNFAIDSDDKIYVVYDDGSGNVTLARYRANGAGLDLTFGTNGIITDALAVPVAGADQIFVGLDKNEKVIVTGATTTTVVASRYTTSGGLDGTFGTAGYTTIADASVILKDLLVGTTAQVGSDTVIALVGSKNLSDDVMYIAWLDQDGILDTSYNPTGVDAGEPGTVEFEVDSANDIRQLKSGVILDDGRVVVVGYETTSGAVDVPLVMRRYSQRYASQEPQAPVFGLPGVLDPSLNGTGTKSFNFTTGAVNQYAQSIWSLDNGSVIIGGYGTISTDLLNNHFILSKIGTDGVFDTSFGTAGVVTTALRTASSDEFLYDIMIDYLDRIVAVGYSDTGVALIRRYLSTGAVDTTFGDKSGSPASPTGTAALSAAQFFAVGMQLNGRLIAIGADTSNGIGVIAGYDLEGVLDPTFGDNGIVHVQDSVALHSMFIDSDDSIVLSYQNGSNQANITRIQENGQPYTMLQAGSTFGTDGTIVDVFGSNVGAADQVKITVDADDKIIIAASTASDNSMKIRRYLSTGDVDTTFNTDGSSLTITVGATLDRSVVSRLMANSVGQYVITGYEDYNAGTENPLIAQVTNAGVLDTSFNADDTPGMNIFTIPGGGTVQKIMGSVILPDGKIAAVGQELLTGLYTPFQVSMFDTQFSDEVNRAPDFVPQGGFDTSFDTDGKDAVYANGATDATANQEIKAVRQLSNLKLMTVTSTGAQSWSLRVDQDGANDVSYGSGTGILIDQYNGSETVEQMQLDGAGNMMIVGTHSTNGGYLKRVLANGTMSPLFGGTSGDPIGTLYNIMSDVYGVAQLTSGNMIVVGNDNGVGTATMISPTSDVDTTFASAGNYTNGANIQSVAVDANDNVYLAVGYLDGATQKVRLVKTNSLGVLDATFGTNGVVDSVISDIDNYQGIRLTLDPDGKVIVAAAQNGTSGTVGVVRYTAAGIFDDQFNAGAQFDVTFSTSTSVVLTSLVALENSKMIVSGYQDGGDTVTNNDQWFVAQLQQAGNFDDEFNTNAQIMGLLTFQVDGSLQQTRHNNDLVVQTDGRVVLAGGESPATSQSTPLLVRILDDQNIESVNQYPGTSSSLINTVYPNFGTSGIAESNVVTNLIEGGYIVLDANGLTNIGGLTQDGTLVAARFDGVGAIDSSYGTSGVATSPVINNITTGGSVAVDGNDKVIISGFTSDSTLAAVRFTTTGAADATFSGDGLAQTAAITDLSGGGFGAADSANRVLVGGMTSTHRLVVARFTAIGDADGTFGTAGIAETGALANLAEGGFIVTDTTNNVYVGGYTSDGTLLVAKFNSSGALVTGFGTTGIAQTTAITNLAGIGSIDLDSSLNPIVGGFTSDGSLVAVRFTTDGVLDTTFNATGTTAGIALTNPISELTIGGFVAVDGLDRINVGGYIVASGANSIVAARFTSDGAIDGTLATGGIITTGTIADLTQGGFVAVDNFDRILTGGMTSDAGNARLIVAKLYSGDEIFGVDPSSLTPEDFKTFRYGNNPDRFRRMILVDYYLSSISNTTVKDAVKAEIDTVLSDYITQYGGVTGYNLVWHMFTQAVKLDQSSSDLQGVHPGAAAIIEDFFTQFNGRTDQLTKS